MKKFLGVILFVPFALSAQKKFVINGNLNGLPEGTAVSLSNANVPDDTLARSVVKSGGAFELRGTVAEPNLYQLNFDGVQKKSVLFIGNDLVNVSGDVQTIQDLTVKGSEIHNDFEEFKKTFNPLFQELTAMGQRINRTPSLQKNDSVMSAYKSHLVKIKSEVDNYVTEHQHSPVAPFVVLVTSEMEQDAAAVERRYMLLDKDVQKGFYGKIVKQQIDNTKTGSIGTDAIDFVQTDAEGKKVSLSSFRGKYVLVDFWASWCRPCREENPNVVKAYNKYKDKNFTILGVSLDQSRAPWLKAIKNDNLVWTQVSDLKGWSNEAAAKYNVQSIPQNFLIDPSGKIVGKNLRGEDLDSRLNELLGSK
ncbi:MAG TPA: TlpA disulfide reductase family protein [Flavitalea sp.]|nr:TlpA disulfide reductase family protein [Flavitalea sp.]